jgi:cysteine desulfurase
MGALTHGNVRVSIPLEAVAPERAAQVDAFCSVLAEVVASVRAELGAHRL